MATPSNSRRSSDQKDSGTSNPGACPVSLFHRKLVCFFAGSMIPFEEVESKHFASLLKTLGSDDPLPKYATLLESARVLAEYYENLLVAEIAAEDYKVTVVFHKYTLVQSVCDYVFVSIHWIDKDFKCDFFRIGLVLYDADFAANVERILAPLGQRIVFVTSNFEPTPETWESITGYFDLSVPDVSMQNSWLFCLPTFLGNAVEEFLLGDDSFTFDTCDDARHFIPSLISRYLGSDYTAILQLDVSLVNPDKNDTGGVHFDILADRLLIFERSRTLSYLEALVFYRDQLDAYLDEKIWSQIEFLAVFLSTFQVVLTSSCSMTSPTSHMVLKWLKILIHTSRTSKWHHCLPARRFEILESRLQSYHDQLQYKFGLITSCYLHPSTRRFMTEPQIEQVRAHMAHLQEDAAEKYGDFEEMILREFSCSGSISNECYNYETLLSHKIGYSEGKPMVSKEGGPALLNFWHDHRDSLPALSSSAMQVYGIQACSDKSYRTMKQSLGQLKDSTQYLREIPGDLHLYNFLYHLVNVRDILADIGENGQKAQYTTSNSIPDKVPKFVTKRRKSNA
ncbi:unnamed protein product [Kuraishia capsulata CBS 1993]|uniref:Uncharacterized protein n=1 Tax=Kuraishia capsulata CBS 1993 TaxID=1382522 RepID=W6MMB5_9ASCO|nr:uncharacterized protein KUCA_T00003321001 [Kuraishia capsulata CBS 1993]CDK27343.1 unnamed protein product [Kuraishia capsulata CBS 1993]